jgi:betaine-aldehyde dehydrogenase
VDVDNKMRVAQEEIFGPVLVVIPFDSEEEAVRIANDTIYGLAGAVWTKDVAKAMRVIKALRAGITWVNTYHPTYSEAPWGGYKQSGIGRELGSYGLDEYTEVKQINIDLTGEPMGVYQRGKKDAGQGASTGRGKIVPLSDRRPFREGAMRKDESWVRFCENCS